MDDISGHEFTGRDLLPCPVPEHAGIWRELLFQEFNGVLCLPFLEKADNRVRHEQEDDDGKVLPVSDDSREDCGCLDHPRDRAPEIEQEFQQRVFLFFGDIVEAVLLPETGDIGPGETGRGVGFLRKVHRHAPGLCRRSPISSPVNSGWVHPPCPASHDTFVPKWVPEGMQQRCI